MNQIAINIHYCRKKEYTF